ncbi:protein-glutamate O-methyltransferase CheR, partial [Desulfobulbus sp. F3]|nr:protein-glutamate O-methyltransferase CheR [Desulfobulbus sp. F3]
MMERSELEGIEIDLLLEAVFRRWGYDFRSYARASIGRRVGQLLEQSGLSSVAGLIPKALHDPAFFQELLAAFSITVSG